VSSSTYSADLEPQPALRALVLVSGILLGVTGLVLILVLPLHPAAILAASSAWVGLSAHELRVLARGFKASRRLRMTEAGSLLRLDDQGHWRSVRLLAGSIVLPGLAWIRFETGRGLRSAELLCGSCRESNDWRRLQVIWRHIGAGE
jgi:hypothetical protein